MRRLNALLGGLLLFGVLTPPAIDAFRAAPTPARIAVATLLLLPPGFFMGMAFPLGMRLAANRSAELTPLRWGVNGATSVCASVLAVVTALAFGISTAFWAGVGCYGAALAAFSRSR